MSGNGVKEKDVSTVNTPATVISGMDSGLVSSTVNSTLENLGDTIGKESDGLNSFPIGIVPSPFVLFATLVKGDTSHKSVNFPTLITPDGNGADVVVSKESVYVVNERLTILFTGFYWANCTDSWGEVSYARGNVELRANDRVERHYGVVVS
ncbi:hypothetical protein Tco_0827394 [Tanacetum coccineum]